jgi:hypothetical protein
MRSSYLFNQLRLRHQLGHGILSNEKSFATPMIRPRFLAGPF